MPRRLTKAQHLFREFDKSFEKVVRRVDTAFYGNYQLFWKNWRGIYLRDSKKLRRAFLELKRHISSLQDDVAYKLMETIELKLQPVFKIQSQTSDKKIVLNETSKVKSELRNLIDKISQSPIFEKEIIILDKKPYEAFKRILKLMSSARRELRIMDAYVEDKLFPLYFEHVPSKVAIKVLTKNMYPRFEAVARVFKKQKTNFEVRVSSDVHDRYLIVDNRAWVIGQSLKDAGNKPLSIVEILNVQPIIRLFDKLWSISKRII